jgi:hypothetical protein
VHRTLHRCRAHEDRAGRQFLIALLSKPDWTARNYFLATQLVLSMPHGARNQIVRRIRTLAESAADVDSRFQALRAKIHSSPGPEDLGAVETFRKEKNVSEPVSKLLIELAGLMKQQQSGRALSGQIGSATALFKEGPAVGLMAQLSAAFAARNDEKAFAAAAELSAAIHAEVTRSADGRRSLDLLDFNSSLQEYAFETARKLPKVSRRQSLERLTHYFRLAVGAGLLSTRQLEALTSTMNSFASGSSASADEYFRTARYLNRSAEWCRATAAKFFGPVASHFEPVEPKAGSLLDHLLRGSIALPLADALEVISGDANRAAGIANSIFDSEASQAVMGLNPGGAIGRLEILKPGDDAGGNIDPRAIYVIPETVSDLKPMKGVLTLDSGNSLSHTQLLAANLGIPNATVPSSMLPVLEPHRGKEVVYAVTPKGAVILRETSSLTKEERELWIKETSVSGPRQSLDTDRLDLAFREIIGLTELSLADSGVRVGPKAANLAQLMRFFPDRVDGGIVIPFGIFAEHISRRIGPDEISVAEQINEAFTAAERMREGGESPAAISAFIYPRLAEFRRKISSMPLLPDFEAALRERLKLEFVTGETFRGVFVRSDTNAEDLPQFTGAGLNLTVPNVVGADGIEQALKDVWASPFTERAYDWRSRILTDSQSVYPSVIIMRAVPVEKSGVIATVNLDTGAADEITVNVSEGVSAVVDGGVAESLLLGSDGSVRLLQQARAPFRRVCLASGGFGLLPAVGNDYLLTPSEIAQIRELVSEVKSKYPPVRTESGELLPWDIEFGFERGQLRLFQIRPLVRFREIQTLNSLAKLDAASVSGTVPLDDMPL